MSNLDHKLGNGLSIVPRSLTMLPGDRQDFTLRGAKIPALYSDANGTYEDDYRVALTPGDDGNADGVYWLESGTGIVSLVMEARIMGTGAVIIRAISSGLDDVVQIIASPTAVEFWANAGMISTTSHTLAAGDIIGLELTGSHAYGLLNGVRVGAWALTDDLARHPFTYDVTLEEPFPATDPSLLPATLDGNWKPGAPIEWTIDPDNGHLSSAGSGETPPIIGPLAQWIAPNIPTRYLLRAQTGDDDDHAFTLANIHIPSLRILGQREFEVDPLDELRFRSNYDHAQTRDMLTWSALDGDFSDDVRGLYTAAEPPGQDTITVTCLLEAVTQFDMVLVTVRAVFYPRNLCAVTPGESVELYTNLDTSIPEGGGFAASAGDLTPDDEHNATWEAPEAIGQVVTLSVSDGTTTLEQLVTVLEVMPVDFSTPYQETIGPAMLAEVASDARTVWARVLSDDDFDPEAFRLSVFDMDDDEWADFKAFHFKYKKSQQPFFIADQAQDRRVIVRMDSDIELDAALDCAKNASFRVVKVGCPFI